MEAKLIDDGHFCPLDGGACPTRILENEATITPGKPTQKKTRKCRFWIRDAKGCALLGLANRFVTATELS